MTRALRLPIGCVAVQGGRALVGRLLGAPVGPGTVLLALGRGAADSPLLPVLG